MKVNKFLISVLILTLILVGCCGAINAVSDNGKHNSLGDINNDLVGKTITINFHCIRLFGWIWTPVKLTGCKIVKKDTPFNKYSFLVENETFNIKMTGKNWFNGRTDSYNFKVNCCQSINGRKVTIKIE